MRMPKFRTAALVCAALACAAALSSLPAEAKPRTRIVVHPAPSSLASWHRRCVDWYAVERRPSGTVITPQMRCHWTQR